MTLGGPDDGDDVWHRAGLLASILQQVPHGIAVYGPDRRLTVVNDAYGRIMDGAPIHRGETMAEVIRKRAAAGEFGPGDPDAIVAEQLAHDISIPQTRRRRRPNGRTIDIRTAPLPDGGHISVVTDVTELVAATEELERRAATLDTMLANIAHGIVLWDADRTIVAANAAATELLHAPEGLMVPGRTLEEVVQSALDRGNLGHGKAAQERARVLRQEDRSKPQQDQRLTQTGQVLEVRSLPTPNRGFVTTYTDVTGIRQAEEALLLAKTAAEAANVAKSRFLATMSTELRSPLNTILSEVAAITRDAASLRTRADANPMVGRDAVRIQESCSAAAEEARRLLALIDSILDVARVEGGRYEIGDDTVDLHSLVRQCLRLSDTAAAAAEIVLVVELPDQLPTLRCDERRLRQALCHLIANAVKFTASTGTVSLRVQPEPPSGDLLLLVVDTGVGIPQDSLERVFEPFNQLGAVRTGAGLGLYISRMLLRAHGGDVVLNSVVGQGTTATVRIPARRVMQNVDGNPN